MNVSMYQAAAALNVNSRMQEVIAENLAASSVPGYKKQQLSVEAVRSGLMPAGSLNASGPQFFTLPKAVTSTNFSSGDMQYTGANTDIAIQGQAFLSVALPNGQTGLTRDGELQVNAQGQLVTKQGYPVLGESGNAIQLDLNNAAPISISSTGVVAQGANQADQLKLTEFDKPGQLTQIGGGYYTAKNPNVHAVPSTSTVKQGYIEASNTSVVTEMTDMIAAQRGFEANTKIIQMQDDRMGKVISDLGTPA